MYALIYSVVFWVQNEFLLFVIEFEYYPFGKEKNYALQSYGKKMHL